MATIGKIKIGTKSKKNFFDFSHDVNTSSDFGFCQPTLIDLVFPGSNVKINTKQYIRLAPLPAPTFGRVKVHTDNVFIPLRDVSPSFENLMSQTAINARESYVPDTMDYIAKRTFVSYLLAMSNYYGALGQFDKCPFRYAFISNAPLNVAEYNSTDAIPYRDVLNDSSVVNSVSRTNTAYVWLKSMFAPSDADYSGSFWDNYISICGGDAANIPSMITPLGYHSTGTKNYPSVLNFLTNVGERTFYTKVGQTGTYPQRYSAGFNYINKYAGNLVTDDFVSNVSNGRGELNVPISLENCDYFIKIDGNYLKNYTLCDDNGSYTETVVSSHDDAFLCLKLTKFGRRLIRIFIASRQNPFGRYNDKIALAPIFAYYKAWFDIYNPARVQNWEMSDAYYLIHLFYDFGVPLNTYLRAIANPANSNITHFFDFLVSLGSCCYVLPIDNVSVVTHELEENLQNDVNDVKPYYNTDLDEVEIGLSSANVYGNGQPVNDAGGLGVKLLERIYHWTSENSVVGKKVRDYLKKYNILLPKSNILSRDSYMCEISDVFSTAETDLGYLGEYAGKGQGDGVVSLSLQDTKEYGFIIQLFSIAPHAGYVQGDVHFPLTRMEFYQPEFDSLGKEPVGLSEIANRSPIVNSFASDEIFGFRPRYFGLKFRNNIANGYFSERSSRSQYLPYSLDRLFSEQDYTTFNNGTQIRKTDEFVPYAGEDIRFVGLDESCGLYDRIFYDNDGLTDNFIVHILQDYKCWSPMKPVSESYDTFDKDVHDTTTEVEHS